MNCHFLKGNFSTAVDPFQSDICQRNAWQDVYAIIPKEVKIKFWLM